MKSKRISRKKETLFSAADFRPENVKVRITMFVAQDVLEAYRREADSRGIGYQTLMQEHLRNSIGIEERPSLEKRVERLEKAIRSKAG